VLRRKTIENLRASGESYGQEYRPNIGNFLTHGARQRRGYRATL